MYFHFLTADKADKVFWNQSLTLRPNRSASQANGKEKLFSLSNVQGKI